MKKFLTVIFILGSLGLMCALAITLTRTDKVQGLYAQLDWSVINVGTKSVVGEVFGTESGNPKFNNHRFISLPAKHLFLVSYARVLSTLDPSSGHSATIDIGGDRATALAVSDDGNIACVGVISKDEHISLLVLNTSNDFVTVERKIDLPAGMNHRFPDAIAISPDKDLAVVAYFFSNSSSWTEGEYKMYLVPIQLEGIIDDLGTGTNPYFLDAKTIIYNTANADIMIRHLSSGVVNKLGSGSQLSVSPDRQKFAVLSANHDADTTSLRLYLVNRIIWQAELIAEHVFEDAATHVESLGDWSSESDRIAITRSQARSNFSMDNRWSVNYIYVYDVGLEKLSLVYKKKTSDAYPSAQKILGLRWIH